MQVTLSKPELEKFIREQVEAGHFSSPEELVEAAVAQLMLDLRTGELDEETWAAIAEGNARIERGEGIDLEQFTAEMRKKHSEQAKQ